MINYNDVTDAFSGWSEIFDGIRNSGDYVAGRWVASAPFKFKFSGVIQNATPDDLEFLPEGNRTHEAIKIHTTYKLIPQLRDTTTGDIVFYGGLSWIVHSVANRYIGGYYKAIAIRD